MRAAIAIGCLVLAGCSKSDAKASASAAASAPASAAALASASAPAPATPTAWSGKYTAAPGSFYVPDGGEWSGVKFRGDDAGVGLGDGEVNVTIEPNGRAHGTLDGPLGTLKVDGLLADGVLSAAVRPGDPAHDFSGSLIGKLDAGKIAGTMRVSLPMGNVIREAPFTLEKR